MSTSCNVTAKAFLEVKNNGEIESKKSNQKRSNEFVILNGVKALAIMSVNQTHRHKILRFAQDDKLENIIISVLSKQLLIVLLAARYPTNNFSGELPCCH